MAQPLTDLPTSTSSYSKPFQFLHNPETRLLRKRRYHAYYIQFSASYLWISLGCSYFHRIGNLTNLVWHLRGHILWTRSLKLLLLHEPMRRRGARAPETEGSSTAAASESPWWMRRRGTKTAPGWTKPRPKIAPSGRPAWRPLHAPSGAASGILHFEKNSARLTWIRIKSRVDQGGAVRPNKWGKTGLRPSVAPAEAGVW